VAGASGCISGRIIACYENIFITILLKLWCNTALIRKGVIMFGLESVKSLYERAAKGYPEAVVHKDYTHGPRARAGLSYDEITLLSSDGTPIRIGDYVSDAPIRLDDARQAAFLCVSPMVFEDHTLEALNGIDYVPSDAVTADHNVVINQYKDSGLVTLSEADNHAYLEGYDDYPRVLRSENPTLVQLHKIVRNLTRSVVVLDAARAVEVNQQENLTRPTEARASFIPIHRELRVTRTL
jgi:hypothetical protein